MGGSYESRGAQGRMAAVVGHSKERRPLAHTGYGKTRRKGRRL